MSKPRTVKSATKKAQMYERFYKAAEKTWIESGKDASRERARMMYFDRKVSEAWSVAETMKENV